MTVETDQDIAKYLEMALAQGASEAKVIDPSRVPTEEWVRWKCQFGCNRYDKGYACPPYSPEPATTRAVLDSYHRAILMRFPIPQLAPGTGASRRRHTELHVKIVDLEEAIFKDGYYRAFSLLFGPCTLCPECFQLRGEPCKFRARLRPSMEACGIDVFKTVRLFGGELETLSDVSETRYQHSLLLLD